MKGIIFMFSLIFSYILGFTLNKGLSSTNIIRESIENGIEILKYDIPFIYTVRLNEMFILITATIFFFLSIYYYYSKSETSICQLFKLLLKTLWVEIILCMFIMGSWGVKIVEDLGENSFFSVYEWTLIFKILSLLVFFCMLHEYDNLKNKIKEKDIKDLYLSREKLLPVLDLYLEISKSFSIVGHWGIGKTKLIENFFKGIYSFDENGIKIFYKDKYECIYLDASSYTDNKRLIEILEKELNQIFKKSKIFKLDKNISNEFFNISNNFIGLLKNICFSDKNLNESRETLNKKAKEYQNITNKKIVLCLDNLERIDNKERIINLLSIVEELFSSSVTKIYLYDEDYMEKLFGEDEFKRYIEKYSELKIRVNKLKTEEIIEKNEKVLELIEKYKINFEKELSSFSENVKEIKHSIEMSEMIKTMYPNKEKEEKYKKEYLEKYQKLKISEKKENEIKKIYKDYQDKIYNPRYVLGMKKFIESNYLGYSLERLFEYKLIIDIFSEFDLNNEILRRIFFEKKNYEYIKKEEELNELYNGKVKKEEEITEGIIESLKQNCQKGLGKDLYYYIDYCKKNDVPVDRIKEVLKENRKYDISDLITLMNLIKIDLEDGIDLNLLENFNVKIKKDFFGKNENYSEEESREMIKIMLILYYLKKVRSFIKYTYNKKEKYSEIVKLFESDGRTFKEELKNILGISFDKFINGIKEEFCAENRKEDNQLFKIINKQKLEKEYLILNELNIIFEKENEAKLKTKLNQEYFNQMFEKNSGIHIKAFMNIETLEIRISDSYHGIKETIDKSNIGFYLEKIGKIKNNIEAEELLVEIYLLKQRIKHLKIKKIRSSIDKIKKYYKNN